MSEEALLSPAERRRRKILERGNSRLEKITGLQQQISSSDAGRDENTDEEIQTSLGPKLPARKPPSSHGTQKETVSGPPATQTTRKVGTAADGAWTKYSVGVSSPGESKKKRKNSAGLLRLHSLNKVDRMSAAVAVSERLRIMAVLIVSLLLCLFKDGTHTPLATDKEIRVSYKSAVASCSRILDHVDVGTASQCLSRIHRYGVQKIQRYVADYIPPGLCVNILNNRPMLFVFAVSLGVILMMFFASYVAPSVLGEDVEGAGASAMQQNESSIVNKVFKLLPPHVTKVLRSVNLFKTLVNTLFLDAGYYIVISVSYQLLPLAWS